MFRRKPADVAVEEPVADEPVESVSRAYTPKKGEATPKRVIAGKRPVEAPPMDRREALRRSRQKDRETRADQRERMMAGDQRYLMNRDKGPDRALVRDIVDSRFNVGTYFIVGLFLIVFGSSPAMPRAVQAGANLLLLFMVLAFAVDAVLLCRRVRKLVTQRLPKQDIRWRGLYWYAIMRTLSFRRLRVPKPRVKPGDTI